MVESADYDQFVKKLNKMVDDWNKAIDKIAKDMSAMQAQIDDMEALQKKIDALKKQRESLKNDADDVNKDLIDNILRQKVPPKADPQQMLKLPDFISNNIDKNGIKLGGYGSLKPDIDFDVKKMQFKKVGLTWTWRF